MRVALPFPARRGELDESIRPRRGLPRICPALLWSLLAAAAPAAGAENDWLLEQQDRIRELERQVAVLVNEVAALRTGAAVPEEPGMESRFGLGPAASKIYGAATGLSLGGYAEGAYSNQVGDAEGDGTDRADLTRMVLYVGHKFDERLLFNAEIEFEHASTSKAGEVSLEFASLEYLLRDELNLRAGLLLIPMGFLNEMHEPPFYYGTQRPEVEEQIIPTTWRENGVGVFGQVGESISYRAYIVNGFDATGFDSSGLRGGRQKGSKAKAENLAFVARLDLEPRDGLLLGGSFYQGNTAQDELAPSVRTRIWEAHAHFVHRGFHARGLFARASVGDAGALSTALGLAGNRSVAGEMLGGYIEAGMDVLSFLAPGSEKSLVPFFRFEYLDTQHDVPTGFVRDRRQPRRLFIPGIHFKPHPNVVLKLDYRNIDTWGVNTADEVNFGFGLVF
ncbi:MAG: hypothetical protein ACE5FG_04915 [Myxococcota bacterium]